MRKLLVSRTRSLLLPAVLLGSVALSGCAIGLGVSVPVPFGSVNIGAGPGGMSVGVGIGGRHGGVSIGGMIPVYPEPYYHERHEGHEGWSRDEEHGH